MQSQLDFASAPLHEAAVGRQQDAVDAVDAVDVSSSRAHFSPDCARFLNTTLRGYDLNFFLAGSCLEQAGQDEPENYK